MTARGGGGPSGASGGTTIAAAGAAVLRAGSLYGAIAGAAGVVVSAFWGPAAAASFALGAALSVGALAVGPLLLRASQKASPPAVTAAAVGGYAGVVLVLGGAFLALAPVNSLSSEHLAAALVAVTVAGLAGQIRAVTRLRMLAFGEPPDPQVTGSAAARSDDAAQSSRPTTR